MKPKNAGSRTPLTAAARAAVARHEAIHAVFASLMRVRTGVVSIRASGVRTPSPSRGRVRLLNPPARTQYDDGAAARALMRRLVVLLAPLADGIIARGHDWDEL